MGLLQDRAPTKPPPEQKCRQVPRLLALLSTGSPGPSMAWPAPGARGAWAATGGGVETASQAPTSFPWAAVRAEVCVWGGSPCGQPGPGAGGSKVVVCGPQQGMEDRLREGWAACPGQRLTMCGQGCPGAEPPLWGPCQQLPFRRSCPRTWTSSCCRPRLTWPRTCMSWASRRAALTGTAGPPLPLPHRLRVPDWLLPRGPVSRSRSFGRDTHVRGDMGCGQAWAQPGSLSS